MKGIVLTSHGNLAQGMLETTKLFFDEQPQLEACCLQPSDNPDEFVHVLEEACKRVDTGDGVVVFCDLLFGSPCNCMARIMRKGVDVITGMNLSMVLELLGSRTMADPDIAALCQVGKDGVADLRATLGDALQEQE